MYSLGFIASNPFVPFNNGYLDATNAYLNSNAALSSLTITKQDAINRWFKDLNGYANPSYATFNVWSKIKLIYPFIGGTSTSLGKNARTPGTFDLTHTGSPTFNSNSISYNGTTQYSDTVFVPNGLNSLSTADFTGFAVHRTDTNADSNATCGEIGGGNTYFYCAGGTSGPGFVVLILSTRTADTTSRAFSTPQFYAAAFSNTTTLNAYVNAANVHQTTNTFVDAPTKSLLIGAFNNTTPGYGGPSTYDFYMSITSTWSDAEMASVYNATKALKSVFGVTWN